MRSEDTQTLRQKIANLEATSAQRHQELMAVLDNMLRKLEMLGLPDIGNDFDITYTLKDSCTSD